MTLTDGNLLSADDPRIAGAGAPSGFTYLTETPPDRPSNRRILSMAGATIVLALLLGATAAISTLALTPRYQARAEVQYRGSAWTETQNVLIQSRSINGPIASEFGIDIKEFEEDLDSGLIPGTQILQIDYESTDPELARQIVSRIADVYIAEISEDTTTDAVTILTSQLEQAQIELEVARAELREIAEQNARESAARGEAQGEEAEELIPGQIVFSGTTETRVRTQELQQETNSLASKVSDLESRLLDASLRSLDIAVRGTPEIITEAFVFEDSVFPRPKIFGLVGFIAGLAIGGLVMAWKWNRTAWATIDSPTETANLGKA